jgi:hypothetical protein
VGLLESKLGKQMRELTKRDHEILRMICRGFSSSSWIAQASESDEPSGEDSNVDPVPLPPEKS